MAVLKERYAGQMDFSKASAATKDALSGKRAEIGGFSRA